MLSVLSKKQNNGNKTHQLHKNWSGLGDMEKQKEWEMNLKHIDAYLNSFTESENTRGREMWL